MGTIYGWSFYSKLQWRNHRPHHSYSYDSLNRLSSLTSSGDTSGWLRFAVDLRSVGNRTGQTTTPTTGGSCPNFNGHVFRKNTNRMDSHSYDAAATCSTTERIAIPTTPRTTLSKWTAASTGTLYIRRGWAARGNDQQRRDDGKDL